MSVSRVVLVNPLGSALNHYTETLCSTLVAAGAEVSVRSIDEPSISGRSRASWVADAYRAVRAETSAGASEVIVVWPVLGWLDVLVMRALVRRARSSIVMHDPKPLVRQIGYDPASRRLARALLGQVRVIVHSGAALQVLSDQGVPRESTDVLPHPVAEPVTELAPGGSEVVRVLGQFKADRDLAALARIATVERGCSYEIVGRGWPDVPGWDVRDEFVSEEEFASLLATSSVVLIPYRRFFQSGVALRALESGTPIVGPHDSHLADLLGARSPWLVAGDDWGSAVDRALADRDSGATLEVARQARAQAVAEWRAWL